MVQVMAESAKWQWRRGMTRRQGLHAGLAGTVGIAAAACGTSSGSPSTTDAKPAASKGPVTIDVLTRSGVSSPTGHSQWYAQAAKSTFTPQTNITVNLIDADPSVTEKLTVMASAGTAPDGSWFATVADGSGGREQAARGIFKPLDDLIRRDKFDTKPYFKSLLDLFTVGGKLYALTTMGHYGTNVLYYNKQKTQSAGITVPADGNWSVDEFVIAAQKLVNKGSDIWAFWPDLGMAEFGTFWVRQFGGEFLDEPGKKVVLDTPEARAGLEWVYNCTTKFQLFNDQYRTDSKDTLFETEGKLAFRSTTPGLVAEYRKPDQQRVKFDLGIALFPRGPKGHGTQASGSGMGLCNPAKQDAVWEWVKFITNKDNGVGQVFGGAGSPGGRTDIWNDPKIVAFDPIYSNIIKAYPQGAGTIRWPANNRRVDLLKAVDDELTTYFKGQAGLADATSKAVQAGNAILNQ